MSKSQPKKSIKILVTISFLLMVAVNALADIIPINGVNTGEVSNSYPNLFAPAGFTFAIWGLIYLLLAGYTVYQLGFFSKAVETNANLLNKVGIYFSVSSIANAAWIFAWHFFMIPLSMLLMIVILLCLIVIVQTIKKEQLSWLGKFLIKVPFSIYFGWITVATIANMTTLLVSLGWDGFGVSEVAWAVIMISVGAIIGITVLLNNKDAAYGLVFIWAYAGILMKHISAKGFAGQYSAVITAVAVCIIGITIAEIITIIPRAKNPDLC